MADENEVVIKVETETPQPSAADTAAAAATIVAAAETAVAMAEAQTAEVQAESAAKVAEAVSDFSESAKKWLTDQISPLFSTIQSLTERQSKTETDLAALQERLTPTPQETPVTETPPEKPPSAEGDGQKEAEKTAEPQPKKRRFL
jgi:hypothetical protein